MSYFDAGRKKIEDREAAFVTPGDLVLDEAGREFTVVVVESSFKPEHTLLALATTHGDTVKVVRIHDTKTVRVRHLTTTV